LLFVYANKAKKDIYNSFIWQALLSNGKEGFVFDSKLTADSLKFLIPLSSIPSSELINHDRV